MVTEVVPNFLVVYKYEIEAGNSMKRNAKVSNTIDDTSDSEGSAVSIKKTHEAGDVSRRLY